ncbi:MAG: HesA/MoeB/ThiF family protein [Pseudomonadota bacterium]
MTSDQRYSRNFSALSQKDQGRLKTSRVCIVGLGGLGGGVTEMLARIGVGSLVLVDGDVFEPSNLNRQILCTEKLLGVPKASAAEDRVKAINPTIEVRGVQGFMTEVNSDELLEGCHVAVDCLDTIPARFILEKAAKHCKIPMVSGAIAGTFGQLTTIFPQDRGLELIYHKPGIQPVQGEISGNGRGVEVHLGNLSFCAMFMASLQAAETVKILTGRGDVLRHRILIADLLSSVFEIIQLQ